MELCKPNHLQPRLDYSESLDTTFPTTTRFKITRREVPHLELIGRGSESLLGCHFGGYFPVQTHRLCLRYEHPGREMH